MRAAALLALACGSAAATLAVTEPVRDPDVFWHLASGDWMIDQRRLLDRDVFSFTRAGEPYSVGQWLGQIALAASYRLGGWAGLEWLRAALVGIAVLFVSRAVLRSQPHPAWALGPILLTLLVSRLAWGDRPQLFTLALFPLFLDTLLRARDGDRRALLILPPLALAWANLHAAYPLGLGLMLVFALEAALTRHPARRPFAVAFGAAAIASQINPSGLVALTWAASHIGTGGRQIVEERPLDILSAAGLVYAALLLGALAAALRLGRRGLRRRVGSPLLWAALIVPLTILGLAIQRQLPYACMVLAPFVAAAVPAALGRAPATAPRLPAGVAIALTSLVLAIPLTVGALASPREPDLRAYPAGALDALGGRSGNLIHEYDWGGYLIRFAPDHPTFIDGRLFPFTPGVLADWVTAVEVRPGYREVLARHDIRLALLRPHRALVAALRESGWSEIGAGSDRWVLLVRP